MYFSFVLYNCCLFFCLVYFWSFAVLYCLYFFNVWLLITPLVSSNLSRLSHELVATRSDTGSGNRLHQIQEEIEDTKEVIRIRKSKKARQYCTKHAMYVMSIRIYLVFGLISLTESTRC